MTRDSQEIKKRAKLVWMLYLGMHGTSVLLITIDWMSVCEILIGQSCEHHTT